MALPKVPSSVLSKPLLKVPAASLGLTTLLRRLMVTLSLACRPEKTTTLPTTYLKGPGEKNHTSSLLSGVSLDGSLSDSQRAEKSMSRSTPKSAKLKRYLSKSLSSWLLARLPTRTVSGTTRSPMPTLRLPTSLTSHPYLLLVIMGADEVVSSATNLLTKSSARQTTTGRVMSLKAALTLLKKSTTMFSLCFPPSPPAAAR
mmetsp:Transcript_546/g.960  ORF Transcript_546/g.960 Transcript_546/m.960 type:complete len:201 (-) Transcript_546:699-1301(-)